MNVDLGQWQHWLLIAIVVLVTLAIAFKLLGHVFSQRQQRQRIVAARVRSGHMPLEIPTARGGIGKASRPATLRDPLDDAPDEQTVVDEQPRIHIRYLDIYGKYAERTIEVETLDLHRQAIIAKGDSLHDPRVFPLDRVAEARNAATGQPFNMGVWVDAVRVARRRRDMSSDSELGTLV